jgi:hypothetical protein
LIGFEGLEECLKVQGFVIASTNFQLLDASEMARLESFNSTDTLLTVPDG